MLIEGYEKKNYGIQACTFNRKKFLFEVNIQPLPCPGHWASIYLLGINGTSRFLQDFKAYPPGDNVYDLAHLHELSKTSIDYILSLDLKQFDQSIACFDGGIWIQEPDYWSVPKFTINEDNGTLRPIENTDIRGKVYIRLNSLSPKQRDEFMRLAGGICSIGYFRVSQGSPKQYFMETDSLGDFVNLKTVSRRLGWEGELEKGLHIHLR